MARFEGTLLDRSLPAGPVEQNERTQVDAHVQTNKTDAADARAIWTTAQQPGMRTVAIKSEAQQAILSLHRIRSALVDTRTRQVNQIRGLLGEYGLHFHYGRRHW